jgi:hypothetical protein
VVPWVINNGGRKERGLRSEGEVTERGELGEGGGWGLKVELCRWRGKKFLVSTRVNACILILYSVQAEKVFGKCFRLCRKKSEIKLSCAKILSKILQIRFSFLLYTPNHGPYTERQQVDYF